MMSPIFQVQTERISSSECTMPHLVAKDPIKSKKAIIVGLRRRSTGVHINNADDGSDCSDPATIDQWEPRPPATEMDCSRYPAGRSLKSCFANKTNRRSLTHSVSFDKVEFREYGIILSDNPCTSSGPPIGIGWVYDPNDTLESDIDSYEAHRDGSGGRREKYELRIPPSVRLEMLQKAGYAATEIVAAVRKAQEWQERRKVSVRYQKYDLIFERAERLKKGVQRIGQKRTPMEVQPCPEESRRGSWPVVRKGK